MQKQTSHHLEEYPIEVGGKEAEPDEAAKLVRSELGAPGLLHGYFRNFSSQALSVIVSRAQIHLQEYESAYDISSDFLFAIPDPRREVNTDDILAEMKELNAKIHDVSRVGGAADLVLEERKMQCPPPIEELREKVSAAWKVWILLAKDRTMIGID